MVASYSYVLEDLKALLCHELQTLVERFGSCEKVRRPAGSRSSTHPIDGAGDRNRGNDSACRVSDGSRDAGDTGLTFGCALCPAAPANLEEHSFAEGRIGEDGPLGLWICPCEKDLGAGSGVHRQSGSDEHRVTQAGRWFHRRDADALCAFATVQLDAFAGDFAKAGEDESGRSNEWIISGGSEFGESGPWAPLTVRVASEESMDFETDGESMGGRARQTGSCTEFGEAARFLSYCMKHAHCFVQDADAAMLSHRSIPVSRIVGCYRISWRDSAFPRDSLHLL